MACIIFGAGSYYGLEYRPQPGDYIIAADGGWQYCKQEGIVPDLLLGDFDSLAVVPDFAHIHRVPVEKDDSDMMLAIKDGLAHGQREFHLYGGMGGARSDHTLANMQSLLYLTCHGARGWLYGDRERYTVIRDGSSITFPAKEQGIMSVFCMGADAEGVSITGAQYPLSDAALSAEFPLGVSNHFIGNPVTVSVRSGSLLIGLLDK